MTETELDRKQKDLVALSAKSASIEKQIVETQRMIADAQTALTESMTTGKGEAAALKVLLSSRVTLHELDEVRSALGVRLAALRGELKAARVLSAEQLTEEIKITYEATMIDLITCLEATWTQAAAVADLYFEAQRTVAGSGVANPVQQPSYIGDFNIERFTNLELQAIEQHMPDLFKNSGCIDSRTRSNRRRLSGWF